MASPTPLLRVYLAIPYTADPQLSFETVNRVAAHLIQTHRWNVFSPISMTHPMAVIGKLPGDWSFWGQFDEEYIAFCDVLLIVALSGWEDSKGVRAELALARRLGKPVRLIDPDNYEITDLEDGVDPFVRSDALCGCGDRKMLDLGEAGGQRILWCEMCGRMKTIATGRSITSYTPRLYELIAGKR